MDSGRDQRASKRVMVGIKAELECQGRLLPVIVVDLSVGGALLECAGYAWPDPGDALMLGLSLGASRLQLLARLIRKVGKRRAAIAFGAMDGGCDRALARFVQEQELHFMKAQQHLSD